MSDIETVHEIPEACHTNQEQHVHFDENTDGFTHDSEIIVKQGRHNVIEVHVGFLQLNHKYTIAFFLPSVLIPGNSSTFQVTNFQSIGTRLLDMTPSEDGVKLVVEFTASREKLLKEEILVRQENDDSVVVDYKLVIYSRVLGKGKGTPSLRSGINCIAIINDDDSEHSDWQGFD
ncbi:Uncharacterised protein g1623 [Pycnogonum litorale]